LFFEWGCGYIGEEVAGGEEGFAKVASDNLFRVADGGQVDAGIPAKQYIDIRRYVVTEHIVGRRRPEEGDEEFGDAGGMHLNFGLQSVESNSRLLEYLRVWKPDLKQGIYRSAEKRCATQNQPF
jgi:hypothetical protein